METASPARVKSTSDVPLETVRQLADELAGEIDVTVDKSQAFFRSVEPPSWVALLAEANWWMKACAAYAALFVAKIVEEAAKDTWKNRGKLITGGMEASNRIRRVAIAIFNLKRRIPLRTEIEIGLPFPDDHFATRLTLTTTDPDDLAVEIALFVHHLTALAELIEEEALSRASVATGIYLQLLDDGSLEVSWQDNESFKQYRRILPLEHHDAA